MFRSFAAIEFRVPHDIGKPTAQSVPHFRIFRKSRSSRFIATAPGRRPIGYQRCGKKDPKCLILRVVHDTRRVHDGSLRDQRLDTSCPTLVVTKLLGRGSKFDVDECCTAPRVGAKAKLNLGKQPAKLPPRRPILAIRPVYQIEPPPKPRRSECRRICRWRERNDLDRAARRRTWRSEISRELSLGDSVLVTVNGMHLRCRRMFRRPHRAS